MKWLGLLALTPVFAPVALADDIQSGPDKPFIVYSKGNQAGDNLDFWSYSLLIYDPANGPVLCSGLKIAPEAPADTQAGQAAKLVHTFSPHYLPDAGAIADMLPASPDNDKGSVKSYGSCQVFGFDYPGVFESLRGYNPILMKEYFGDPLPSMDFVVLSTDPSSGVVDMVPTNFFANVGMGFIGPPATAEKLKLPEPSEQHIYDDMTSRTFFVLETDACSHAGFDQDLYMAARGEALPDKPLFFDKGECGKKLALDLK